MKLKHALYLLSLLTALGLILPARAHGADAAGSNLAVDYYTCAMHPSVRSQDPDGHCPICTMHLVPVYKRAANASPNAETATVETPTEFTVPMSRQQFIGVTYATIEKKPLETTLRTLGTVAVPRSRRWDYASRIEGYVQQVEVSSPGEIVEKDQPLLTIYSPDLLTAQQEFLNLLRMRDDAAKANASAALESATRLLESSRHRLLLWNVSSNQIAQLEESRVAKETLTLYSPFKGVVQNLAVDQGQRVNVGDRLVDVADLSVVWVWAQFYEEELPLLKLGGPVTVTSDGYPDQKCPGKIALINPFLNTNTRTVMVRIDIENPDFKLRPDMYVNVALEHKLEATLAVPVSAVLPTGERNLVFIDKGNGRIEPRYIKLGRQYGDDYAVNSGLAEGDRVVNSANFLIDAEAQVQGALKSW